jgi:phosphoglycolate phosphatase
VHARFSARYNLFFMNKPDALIFDMDGTLWDAVDTYAQGFNDYFATNQLPRRLSKAELFAYMGLEQAPFLEVVFPDQQPAERNRQYAQVIERQYERVKREGGQLYPGVREGLAALSEHYALFIVSNCPEFMIDHFMRWADIESYITDSMAHGVNYQPKHANIRHLIAKHNLQSPYYVGDTASDAQQSSLVPLPFAFVDYGFGQTEDYALRFSSFPELTAHFLSL